MVERYYLYLRLSLLLGFKLRFKPFESIER